MQAQASGDKAEIRQAYVPALRTQLLKPLLERGSDAIPEVLPSYPPPCYSPLATPPTSATPPPRCEG